MLSKKVMKIATAALSSFACTVINAAESAGIAGIANNITGTFKSIGQLMIGGSYVGGIALTIAAIFKFKQHKDNPQQVQMGVPITMLLVGVALIFLPSLIQPAGQSIFGSNATVGGVTGSGFSDMMGSSGN